MSKLNVVPVFFRDTADGLVPIDPVLYSRILNYCEENLAEVPDLRRYRMTYAVVEYGEAGEIIEIHGLSSERRVPDIGIFRVTGPRAKQATALLHDRWQNYFSDQGFGGQDVMIWIDREEPVEAQCVNRANSIKNFKLRPAKRMLVRVK